LAYLVNTSTDTFLGKTIALQSDLDMSRYLWIPMGQSEPFRGVLDGKGYSIEGLLVNDSTLSAGLFDSCNGATVKKITVSGIVKGLQAAGIAAEASNSCFANCINECRIYAEGNSNGGIVGDLDGGMVEGCINYGSISGGDTNGGIVGLMDNGGEIMNCSNFAQSITANSVCGGIVGNAADSVEIDNCFSKGEMNSAGSSGGIAGETSDVTIRNCLFTGEVFGLSKGGIIGENLGESAIDNCFYLSVAGGQNDGVYAIGVANGVAVATNNFDPVIGNGNYVDTVADQNSEITVNRHFSDHTANLEEAFNASALAYKFNSDCNFRPWQTSWESDGYPVPVYMPVEYWEDVVTTQPYGYHQYGTKIDISTAEGLVWLAKQVNFDNIFGVIQINLTADIDLSDYLWTPIGGSYATAFRNNFDGKGHRINGLYINNNESNQGLFGQVRESSIQNVRIESGIVSGGIAACGVASNVSDSTINNVSNNADIYAANISASGIAGFLNESSKIVNCSNHGEIMSLTNLAGGIASSVTDSQIVNCCNRSNVAGLSTNIGGIAGTATFSDIINCYSTGNVSYSQYYDGSVGAIAGSFDGGYATKFHYLYYHKTAEINADLYGIGFYKINADTEVATNDEYTMTYGAISYVETFETATDTITINFDGYDINEDLTTLLNLGMLKTKNLLLDDIWFTWDENYPRFVQTPLTYWKNVVTSEPEDGYYDNGDTIEIETAEAFAWLISVVNGLNGQTANTLAGKTVRLIADIDLSAHLWTGIGAMLCPFCGSFYGNGYTVSGLYTYTPNTAYSGLFIYTRNAVIDSVLVESGLLNGYNSVGAIVGYPFATAITNSYNKATIYSSNRYAGGIAGYFHDSVMVNCYNAGEIFSSYSEVGGLAGVASLSHIVNCYNTGSVTALYDNVGGIIGYSDFSTIINCYISGVVRLLSDNDSGGGIIGFYDSSTMDNCYYLKTPEINGGLYAVGYLNWVAHPSDDFEPSQNITNVRAFASPTEIMSANIGSLSEGTLYQLLTEGKSYYSLPENSVVAVELNQWWEDGYPELAFKYNVEITLTYNSSQNLKNAVVELRLEGEAVATLTASGNIYRGKVFLGSYEL
ncbi:MAG: GLUG motif-containing protein, partial [Clostridia bacterium]|nr:GLUG motif-containing protein [Clostridia bacterium]